MASTFVTSIAAVALYDPVLNDAGDILGAGNDGRVTLGALLEIILMISLLAVTTLRDDLAASIGPAGGSLDIAGRTLVAIHDWTFLLGPGFCVGVNGLLLGWLMYRSGLMPPRLAMLGVIGGPLIFASSIAVLFGAYEQDGAHLIFSLPEAAFEASFAIYLIVRGFRPSPILPHHGTAPGPGGNPPSS